MSDPILAPAPRRDPVRSPTGQPVPVTLLTGFLGAGKTTLLNRLLQGDHGLRVGVLVNDFGAVNIDGELISAVEENTISLTNGCVCCEIRDDLIDSLEELLLGDRAIDYVILEASGIADPEAVVMTFLQPRYNRLLRLDSITCVVDADALFSDNTNDQISLLKLRQIGFADLVVINKIDLVDSVHLEAARSWVEAHFNRVRLIEASHCDVPYEILLAVGRFDPARLGDAPAARRPQHTANFDTFHYVTDEPLNESALRETIRRLPAAVYRCKGFVHLADRPGERVLVQAVGRRVELTPIGPWALTPPQSDLVFIGADGSLAEDHLTRILDACQATPVIDQPDATG